MTVPPGAQTEAPRPPGAQTEARSDEVEHLGRASGFPASEVGTRRRGRAPGPEGGVILSPREDPPTEGRSEVRRTARPAPPRLYRAGQLTQLDKMPPPERAITLIVDGEELATVACSPHRVLALALGFLRVEDIIQSADDVELMEVCDEETVVKIRLAKTARRVPHDRKRILTSGCGRGVTFSLDVVPVGGGMTVRPERLMEWMETLLDRAEGYREHGGTHTAGLFGPDGLEICVEDIGRHNTIDRIAGEAILTDVPTAGKAILTSGRISSDMLVKSSRLGVGITASRTSPTELAVSLAQEANIAVCGYVRRDQLRIFHEAGRMDI